MDAARDARAAGETIRDLLPVSGISTMLGVGQLVTGLTSNDVYQRENREQIKRLEGKLASGAVLSADEEAAIREAYITPASQANAEAQRRADKTLAAAMSSTGGSSGAELAAVRQGTRAGQAEAAMAASNAMREERVQRTADLEAEKDARLQAKSAMRADDFDQIGSFIGSLAGPLGSLAGAAPGFLQAAKPFGAPKRFQLTPEAYPNVAEIEQQIVSPTPPVAPAPAPVAPAPVAPAPVAPPVAPAPVAPAPVAPATPVAPAVPVSRGRNRKGPVAPVAPVAPATPPGAAAAPVRPAQPAQPSAPRGPPAARVIGRPTRIIGQSGPTVAAPAVPKLQQVIDAPDLPAPEFGAALGDEWGRVGAELEEAVTSRPEMYAVITNAYNEASLHYTYVDPDALSNISSPGDSIRVQEALTYNIPTAPGDVSTRRGIMQVQLDAGWQPAVDAIVSAMINNPGFYLMAERAIESGRNVYGSIPRSRR